MRSRFVVPCRCGRLCRWSLYPETTFSFIPKILIFIEVSVLPFWHVIFGERGGERQIIFLGATELPPFFPAPSFYFYLVGRGT